MQVKCPKELKAGIHGQSRELNSLSARAMRQSMHLRAAVAAILYYLLT
jgi:hypothetical protein